MRKRVFALQLLSIGLASSSIATTEDLGQEQVQWDNLSDGDEVVALVEIFLLTAGANFDSSKAIRETFTSNSS